MDKLIMVLQFIIGLSIIVGIHELGHMLMARLFGIRVDHFMIGFPPKIFKFKIGHTEYALGAIPFGGSAKIAGMVDESFDKTTLASEPKPWEYRSKPHWQKLIVILGGIIFNMIFGIIIFIGLAKFVGTYYIPKEEFNKSGLYPTELGKELGFKTGDKVLKLNDKDFKKFEELQSTNILLKGNTKYTVLRGDDQIEIIIGANNLKSLNNSESRNVLFSPLYPYEIKKVVKGSNAYKAGLKKGDVIITINDIPANYSQTLEDVLKEFSNKTVSIQYSRDGNINTTIIDIDNEGHIGILIEKKIKLIHHKYSLGKAIPWGIKSAFLVVWTNVLAIKHMIKGNLSVSKSLKGPVGILKFFGTTFNWAKFWYIIAFLSMIIAFTNLLPIPALDGGHMVFILYEMVTGKKLSDKVLLRFQVVGAAILLSIIAYTLINDIIKLFKN